MAKAKSAIPDGFRSLTPYLIVAGATTFLDFIQNAFGAGENYLMRDPDGIVRHAEARIGDAMIEFAEAGPGWSAMPAGLHFYVKNADDVYARALKAGGTSLYDAIYFAAKEKLMMDQPRDKFRRAMIVISDGEDTESRMSRDQALEMAQKADVVIYAISTNITREDKDGDKVLRYLTEETGGQAFFPFKVEDLDQSFENIANELRHQYNIFYRPDPLKTDGLYHPVTVKTKTRKDLVVRARKGYYAPKL